VCSKYILKKQFRLHTKLHDGVDTLGRIEDLDTSREDEPEDDEVTKEDVSFFSNDRSFRRLLNWGTTASAR
jgi:hypothetical protein